MTGKLKMTVLIVAGLLAVVVLAVVAEITRGARSISTMPLQVFSTPGFSTAVAVMPYTADPNKTVSAEDVENIKKALISESARVGLYDPLYLVAMSQTNVSAAFYRRSTLLKISITKTNNVWTVTRVARGILYHKGVRGTFDQIIDKWSMWLP